MPMPATRMTDLHICALCPVPSGAPVLPCALTVIIGGQPAARMLDVFSTCPPPAPLVPPGDPILMGSPTVLTQGQPQARIMDPTLKAGTVMTGFPTVIVGP